MCLIKLYFTTPLAGTCSLIQLCVRNKDEKIKVYAVVYNQRDGHYYALGVLLASFLDGIVMVDGCTGTNEYREANGVCNLFPRIIAYLKKSLENVGSCSSPTQP